MYIHIYMVVCKRVIVPIIHFQFRKTLLIITMMYHIISCYQILGRNSENI